MPKKPKPDITHSQAASVAAAVTAAEIALDAAQPPQPPCCGTCSAVRRDKHGGVWRCHAKPPTPMDKLAYLDSAQWPVVDAEAGWCRQWIKAA